MRAPFLALLLAVPAFAVRAAPAGGVIVQLKPTPETALAARGAAAPAALARLGGPRLHAVRPTGARAWVLDYGRLLDARQAQALADGLAADPGVEWAVPDSREQRLDVTGPVPPLDPRYASGEQWWLGAPEAGARGVADFLGAWPVTTGAAAVVVAVLDTGYTDDPQLAGRMLPGHDFVAEVAYANDGDGRDADAHDPGDWVTAGEAGTATFAGCEVQDSSWHGTSIAGLIGATTNEQPLALSVASIDWNARLLPVRVAGKCGAAVSDIVDGMRWAAGLPVAGVPDNPFPARIVNISFGGDAPCNAAYQQAIDELAAAGTVVVAAAGNTRGGLERPASCRGVVAVGAVHREGFKAQYSAFGSGITLMATGGDPGDAMGIPGDGGLLTIDNDGTTTPGRARVASLFGTSFAAPLASGTLALMASAHPQLSAGQLVAGLKASARAHVAAPASLPACSPSASANCLCSTATCGAGLLDAAAAVRWTPAPAAGADGGGGGGGALGWPWLAALAAVVLSLFAGRAARR